MRIRLEDPDTGYWFEDDIYLDRPAVGDTVIIDDERWVIQMFPGTWIKNKATGILELTLVAKRFDDRVKGVEDDKCQ